MICICVFTHVEPLGLEVLVGRMAWPQSSTMQATPWAIWSGPNMVAGSVRGSSTLCSPSASLTLELKALKIVRIIITIYNNI